MNNNPMIKFEDIVVVLQLSFDCRSTIVDDVLVRPLLSYALFSSTDTLTIPSDWK